MAECLLTRPPRGRVIAVMVAWNGKAFLETAVASVLRELTDEDDLLVVENGSTDGSFEFLRARFPEVAVLRTGENLGGAGGFAAGVRVALQDGGCRYVWLLDNDILVEPGALAPLMAVLEKDQRAAAAGSQLCLYDDPGVIQEVGASYSPWHGGLRQCDNGRNRLDPQTPPRRVDYLAACSLLVRVEAFRRWGVFREEFFVFYDDVEWSLRVRAGGEHLWAVPASVVHHCYGGIKATIPWREYYRKRNRCACLRLHPPHYGGLLVLYAYLVFLNYLARFRQWQGDTVLAEIYRMALEDFLAGRFGRREIPPGAGDGELPKVLAEAPAIWIHHGLALGDALAVLDAIASRYGGQSCYLSGRSGDEAVLAGRPGVVLGGPPPNGRVAVVGEVYDWHAARFPCVVRYRCGGRWERVPAPMAEYWKTRLKMGVALFLAVVVALPQWLVALRRKWPPPPFP